MRGAPLVALLLAGCLGQAAPPETHPAECPPEADCALAPCPAGQRCETDIGYSPASISAPVLPSGRAWTYEGTEFYNEDTKFDVVVLRADEKGYLFGGGAEDDLVYEAVWGGRWYGERTPKLDPAESGRHLLDFPLSDGKSWAYSDDGLTLTARAKEVATPRGLLPGFVIEGRSDAVTMHAEYAPDIGNLVALRVVYADGIVGQDVRMTQMREGVKGLWYEGGPRAATDAANTLTLDVPPGFDAVLVSAGGMKGGRAALAGPTGAHWQRDFPEEAETWKQGILAADVGRWAGAIEGRPFIDGAPTLPRDTPLGWGYMAVGAVKWVRPR